MYATQLKLGLLQSSVTLISRRRKMIQIFSLQTKFGIFILSSVRCGALIFFFSFSISRSPRSLLFADCLSCCTMSKTVTDDALHETVWMVRTYGRRWWWMKCIWCPIKLSSLMKAMDNRSVDNFNETQFCHPHLFHHNGNDGNFILSLSAITMRTKHCLQSIFTVVIIN